MVSAGRFDSYSKKLRDVETNIKKIIRNETGFESLFIVLLKLISKSVKSAAPIRGRRGINQEADERDNIK